MRCWRLICLKGWSLTFLHLVDQWVAAGRGSVGRINPSSHHSRVTFTGRLTAYLCYMLGRTRKEPSGWTKYNVILKLVQQLTQGCWHQDQQTLLGSTVHYLPLSSVVPFISKILCTVIPGIYRHGSRAEGIRCRRVGWEGVCGGVSPRA